MNSLCFTPDNSLGSPSAAVEQAIKSLGHQSVDSVRVGKTVTFKIDGDDTQMRAQIDKLCDGLLSNPVIEDYVSRLSRVKIFRYLDKSGSMGSLRI